MQRIHVWAALLVFALSAGEVWAKVCMSGSGTTLPAQGGGAICEISAALEGPEDIDFVNWAWTSAAGRLQATVDSRPVFVGRVFVRDSGNEIIDRLRNSGRSLEEAIASIENAVSKSPVCPDFVSAGGLIHYEIFAGATKDPRPKFTEPLLSVCHWACGPTDSSITYLATVRIETCEAN